MVNRFLLKNILLGVLLVVFLYTNIVSADCSITTTLSLGSKGPQVVCLQTTLGGLIADGNFGPQTKSTVITFQQDNGLTADGVVGPKTISALTLNKQSQGPVGPAGPQGIQGPAGTSSLATPEFLTQAGFVSRTFFDGQVNRIFDSISNSTSGLSSALSKEVDTKLLSVSGNATVGGDLTITGNITGNISGILNGLTITGNGTNTLNIAAGKSLIVSNILTLAGTDNTTMTFPTTSATIARTDAGQTFTGNQNIASLIGNKIYPASDSTTAIQINKADGTTNILNVDRRMATSASGRPHLIKN